jgi:non-specific serine/threonine protein kinase
LLRQHRRARQLTQEALAELAGISVRAISDLERGARTHPYRETATLLADALGLTGSTRVALLVAARRPHPPAAVTAHASLGTRLPAPLTALIGRDEERAEIARLLRDDRMRLLTLTGPAGVGKTRLAVSAAADLGDAFREGIVFIDLAPLREPTQVVPAVAAALDLSDQGSIPLLEAVRRRLSTRQMLLVLDNFEHLLAAAPIVSDLLEAGPELQVLVTSRAVLRLRGEREYPVVPLLTPNPGTRMPLEEIVDWEAIQLFVERSCEAHPGFRLTDENAADVVAISHRLDGLPLAIELAAARVKILAPATLLARLEKRLPLLTGGMRDAPRRHRTLQVAIAWSYELLDAREQALFRCLAVFAGGWTLEAAEMVGGLSGVPDVLDALTTLSEQSLVARDDSGLEPRYRMLETIREFAAEQLRDAGDEERVQQAHLQYVFQLVRDNDPERLDAQAETRLTRLIMEEANLQTGIVWALEHDPESALALLAALGYFWMLADRAVAGRDLYARVLMTGAGPNRLERARVLQHAAWLAIYMGDLAQAEPLVTAARALAERLEDARTLAYVQLHQSDIAMSQGDVVRARSLLEDALAQFTALEDQWGIFVCLTNLGIAAQGWGDPGAAAAYFERVGAIVAERNLPARFHAHFLVNLADAYRQLGQHEAAIDACIDALALTRDAGRTANTAWAQLTLGRLLLEQGDTIQAGSLVAQGLEVSWELGDKWNLASGLEVAAAVMVADHHVESAARLFGAAAALRESMPYPIGVGERATHERRLAEVSAALGEPAFTRARTAGQAQSLGDTVAEARAVLATIAR